LIALESAKNRQPCSLLLLKCDTKGSPLEDLGIRRKSLAYATVVLAAIAMVGCQGLSAKQNLAQSSETPPPNPLSISGSITPAASGSGATVTLGGAIETTTTADSSGNYTFSNLVNGSYTVAPSNSGVIFSPPSLEVTVNGTQVTGVNFTASGGSQSTFSVSGTIIPAASASGVTVSLGGASSASTTANSSGAYSFTGLANGSYTITVSKSGFTFTPSSLPVTVSGANVAGENFTATAVPPTTYTISGTITSAANGSGATLTLGGAASATTTANSSGAYSFTGLANGSYTITASKSGFTFNPASLPVTVSGANVTGANFTASAVPPTTYTISGTITSAANGSGATVRLAGAVSATTTANSSGNYRFTGLANGSYTITASKSGFTFNPSSLPVTVSGGNVTGANFTASAVPPTTYTISGIITSAANGSGATLTLGGASSATTTANSSGAYRFTGLANGSYTITASKSGFTFTPSSLPVTVSEGNVTGENFTASAVPPTTYTISGTVTSAANGSGTTLTLGGAASATTTANSSGNYSFTGLANGSYTITASKSGFTFTPSSLPVTVSGANVTGANFTASAVPPTTYTISGTITSAANGSGTTVRLAGAASTTTTANSSGAYSFTGLANGSYTITASKSGFTFTPSSLPVTISGANVTGANFTASAVPPTTYTISGTITSAANGSGATLTLSGAGTSTTASSSGAYSLTGVGNGSYTVTPRKSGFTFSPTSLPVTVSGANVTGMNFAAFGGGVVTIGPGTAVQSVVDSSPAGTTFVFEPGLYRLSSPLSPKNGDSFIGQTACAPPASSCPAILSGSRLIGNLAAYDGTNYKVTGQTQQGVQQYETECDTGQAGCFYPEDLFFDGVPLQHLYSTSLPTILTGQWWFDYANHVIYFHDNPSGHTVETSFVPTVAEVISGPGANNITFQYLTIEEFAAPLQQGGIDPMPLGGTNPHESLNWVVENCELLLNHGIGIHINYGMHALNNYVHNNGQMGIGGGTNSATLQSDVLLSGNTVSYNGYANVDPNFGAGGIKFGDTLGAVVRGNTVTNNGGAGIHFDRDSRSPLIDGNTVTDNIGGSGIVYEVSLVSAVVRNNILQRNGATDAFGNGPGFNLQSADSPGVDAYCNLVEINNLTGENGLVANASNRGNDPNPPFEYLTSTGNYFHHNTVIWDSGAAGKVGYMQSDTTNQPNFFADNTPPDYNTYHQSSLSATDFLYDNNDSGSNTHKTFAEYQAAGADVNGTADTNYTSGFPTVAIASPTDQSSVTTPVTLEATASDASGISKVEFYVDWNLQATVSSTPYNFDWTTATAGAHTVAAMAYSNAGIRSCYAVTLNQQ
jgi:parallel beta-helix repeat protein